MSFTNLPTLKPTIKLTNRRIGLAIYGHIVSMIGGFFMIVSGLMNLFDEPLNALVAIICGIFILIIELDKVHVAPLKDALNRGIIWILLGVISSFGLHFLAIILIFVGGAFYLAYHSQ